MDFSLNVASGDYFANDAGEIIVLFLFCFWFFSAKMTPKENSKQNLQSTNSFSYYKKKSSY